MPQYKFVLKKSGLCIQSVYRDNADAAFEEAQRLADLLSVNHSAPVELDVFVRLPQTIVSRKMTDCERCDDTGVAVVQCESKPQAVRCDCDRATDPADPGVSAIIKRRKSK